MPPGRRILPHQIDHYWSLRGQGYSQRKASTMAGFSLDTAKNLEREKRDTLGNRGEDHNFMFRQAGYVPEWPIRPVDWPERAQEAMADRTGALFMQRYLGMELARWQQYFWQALEDGWEDPDRHYLCTNVGPGYGKSTVLVGFAAKLTVVKRDIRGLFMSRAYSLAERNTLRLRRTLERTVPFVGADVTLACEFGRFKPRAGELWRRNEFVVEQADGTPIEEKEPTWAAFGFDAEWLGNRLDVLFGDDLDSSRGLRNMDTITGNREVFDNELEPRIESGGLLCVAQQRLGAWDFSAHVLAKQILPDDDGVATNPDGVPQYKQVIFKAHYEELCKGTATHAHPAPAWPDGCLLDPRRLSYRDLRKSMRNPRTFEIVFQQNDLADEEALVQKIWLDGGVGADGTRYPGCWDDQRGVWELPGSPGPHLLDGEVLGVITVDPSPTNYWSVQAYVVHPSSGQQFLLDVCRQRMDAPEFLDWAPSLGSFTGVLEDFRVNFDRLGVPLSWVIVEINAAQKFMLQYEHVQRWMRMNGIEVIPHSTNRNKSDPDFGVQMLGPAIRNGQLRLPGRHTIGNLRPPSIMKLVDELLRYRPGFVNGTDDCVMSCWFLYNNLARLYDPHPAVVGAQRWRPSWV